MAISGCMYKGCPAVLSETNNRIRKGKNQIEMTLKNIGKGEIGYIRVFT